MGVRRGRRRLYHPGFLKLQRKMVVLLVSRGKKQISPLLNPYKNF